jgi:hypothetical protein
MQQAKPDSHGSRGLKANDLPTSSAFQSACHASTLCGRSVQKTNGSRLSRFAGARFLGHSRIIDPDPVNASYGGIWGEYSRETQNNKRSDSGFVFRPYYPLDRELRGWRRRGWKPSSQGSLYFRQRDQFPDRRCSTRICPSWIQQPRPGRSSG